jgi:hypothetical protein
VGGVDLTGTWENADADQAGTGTPARSGANGSRSAIGRHSGLHGAPGRTRSLDAGGSYSVPLDLLLPLRYGRGSFAGSMVGLDDLAMRAFSEQKSEEIRLGASLLKTALEDLVRTLAHRFLKKTDADDARSVFQAVVEDHREAEWSPMRFHRKSA